jgi:hypothetical protein
MTAVLLHACSCPRHGRNEGPTSTATPHLMQSLRRPTPVQRATHLSPQLVHLISVVRVATVHERVDGIGGLDLVRLCAPRSCCRERVGDDCASGGETWEGAPGGQTRAKGAEGGAQHGAEGGGRGREEERETLRFGFLARSSEADSKGTEVVGSTSTTQRHGQMHWVRLGNVLDVHRAKPGAFQSNETTPISFLVLPKCHNSANKHLLRCRGSSPQSTVPCERRHRVPYRNLSQRASPRFHNSDASFSSSPYAVVCFTLAKGTR